MSVEVTTREFRFSHGREPRGRGNWAFEMRGGRVPAFPRDASVADNPNVFWATPDQMFSQAVAEARRMAVSRGATTVVVMP